MKNKIMDDLKNAMKNQDKELLSVIRMLKGAIQLEEINLKRELNDEELVSIISKQIKSRRETIEEIKDSSRADLIEKTKAEIEILNRYMPEQMSEEDIIKIVANVIEEVNPTSVNDTGKIMGKLSPLLKGKADMTLVNKIVKEKLSNI